MMAKLATRVSDPAVQRASVCDLRGKKRIIATDWLDLRARFKQCLKYWYFGISILQVSQPWKAQVPHFNDSLEQRYKSFDSYAAHHHNLKRTNGQTPWSGPSTLYVKVRKDKPGALGVDAYFDKVYSKFEVPWVIMSDRDPKFDSDLWRALFKRQGARTAITTVYHRSANGQSERIISQC